MNRDVPEGGTIQESIIRTAALQMQQLEFSAGVPIAFDAQAFVRRLKHVEAEATMIGEAGWTIPMWGTPDEVTQMLHEAASREIDDVFSEYYEAEDGVRIQHLRDSVLRLERLAYWRPLLDQCFDAFDHGYYLVIVPALITAIEGRIIQAGGTGAIKRKDPKHTAHKLRNAFPEKSIKKAIWASVAAFADNLFQKHPFAADRPARLNRAWILHGRDAPDWSKIDCLRLFQALDTLGISIPDIDKTAGAAVS